MMKIEIGWEILVFLHLYVSFSMTSIQYHNKVFKSNLHSISSILTFRESKNGVVKVNSSFENLHKEHIIKIILKKDLKDHNSKYIDSFNALHENFPLFFLFSFLILLRYSLIDLSFLHSWMHYPLWKDNIIISVW